MRRLNILANIDWILVLLYLVLLFFGWVNIYAAVYDEEHQSIFSLSQNYGKQLIWIITALLLAIAILMTDSKFFTAFSFPIYILMILLLIAVLIFGREIGGSRSWFAIGSFRFQPSEFAKFATCLAIAKYLSLLNIKIRRIKTKMITTMLLCIPIVLILLQHDAGSALVYISFIFVLYREGLSGNFLLSGLYAVILFIITLILQNTFIELPFDITPSGKTVFTSTLVLIAVLAFLLIKRPRASRGASVYNKQIMFVIISVFVLSVGFIYSVDYMFDEVLSEHQRNRINELLAIRSDPMGTGYNVNQSKIAIGSGGFIGKGFLQGTQTKYDFVPEQSTDFIFCTIGEEWGYAGSFVVISLFMALLLQIILVAERQRSTFSRIYGYGVASVLFFHLAINIGMTIGLAPVIGIPLPFLSYGGSSLWGFTILLFIFIKMDAYRLQAFS
ncbi:MAG: rod shape-determining protein RodA [Bacteroidota bacterium]